MSSKLYVEGGGDSKTLKTACRKGFRSFLGKAGLTGRLPRIVAGGSRRNAYESFKILEKLDPAKVRDASPCADCFISALSRLSS